jgi:regulatory protein
MALSKARRAAPPIDEAGLQDLALRYVGKYATTRAKLRSYLARKLRERGWDGQREPDLEALAIRLAELGYVDDSAFAVAKSRSLSARGYGKRRLADKLRAAGVDETDSAEANALADSEAVDAALRFARRRRFGPFAVRTAERHEREKWIASMVRAGHPFGLARAIALMARGAEINLDELRGHARLTDV